MTSFNTIFPDRGSSARRIVQEVCAETGVSPQQILSPVRTRHIVRARQFAQWRIYREVGISLPAIGRMFDRDHTSVLHSIRRIDALMKEAK